MEKFLIAVKAVCAISAGACIAENLVSGTSFRNQVRLMLRLLTALVIITPFVGGSLDVELPDAESYNFPYYGLSEEVYSEELTRQVEENISAVLAQQVESAGIDCGKIETKVNISDDFSISIISVTVTAEDFETVSEIIKNSLGSETEVINGYSGSY